MTDTLRELLNAHESQHFATDVGTRMHAKMQCITISDNETHGDADIIANIKSHPELLPFFAPAAMTEVPVAGTIRGRFVSRRIDRMVVNHDAKTVLIMDYKTNVNPDAFRNLYHAQVGEYMDLLCMIYPGCDVRGFILWTHDFSLERVQ